MDAVFPTLKALHEIESRQDEVLRKLDVLEKQIATALLTFGEDRLLKFAPPAANEPLPLARAA